MFYVVISISHPLLVVALFSVCGISVIILLSKNNGFFRNSIFNTLYCSTVVGDKYTFFFSFGCLASDLRSTRKKKPLMCVRVCDLYVWVMRFVTFVFSVGSNVFQVSY